MTAEIFVHVPTGVRPVEAVPPPTPSRTLRGAAIGILDNGKPNFDNLATELAAALQRDLGTRLVAHVRKPSSSIPAGPAIYDGLCGTCDLVIVGSGD